MNIPNVFDEIKKIKKQREEEEEQQKKLIDERAWRLQNAKQMINESI